MAIKYELDKTGLYMVTKASGRWPTTKLAALKESIRKWEFVVSALPKHNNISDGGGSSCALCHLYLMRHWTCTGCPIAEYTGKKECKETPYYDFRHSYNASRVKFALGELAFLKKLVPIVEAEIKEKSSKEKTRSRK